VRALMPPNDRGEQRGRAATDVAIDTGLNGSSSFAPPTGSAFSFYPDALSVDGIRADPTIDAPAIIANLESVALPGFDEMNILVTVDFAQDAVTNLEVVRIRRHNGA